MPFLPFAVGFLLVLAFLGYFSAHPRYGCAVGVSTLLIVVFGSLLLAELAGDRSKAGLIFLAEMGGLVLYLMIHHVFFRRKTKQEEEEEEG